MASKAAEVQVKEPGGQKGPFLSDQHIIIFTVLLSGIFLPLGHVDQCIICPIISPNHRGFMFDVVADSRVPQSAGISFSKMFLGGTW